jgi:hypothetical protein
MIALKKVKMIEIQLLLIVPKFKKRLKRSHKAVLIEEINS